MNDYTKFEEILLAFCRQNKIGKLQPDENLHYRLYVDSTEVRCFMMGGIIYLQVDMGGIPNAAVAKPDFYRQLLQQSLVDAGGADCVLSLSERQHLFLTLQLCLADSHLTQFEEKLAELVNYSEMYESLLLQENEQHRHGFYGMMSVC